MTQPDAFGSNWLPSISANPRLYRIPEDTTDYAKASPITGSRRGQCRPTPSMLADRERAGVAVLRRVQGADRLRSGALFGARMGAVGGTHGTGCFRRSLDRANTRNQLQLE
jgi:hypothetical protein